VTAIGTVFRPVAMADEVMQEQLHRHFGWLGFAT
jgi:hypothetical protein